MLTALSGNSLSNRFGRLYRLLSTRSSATTGTNQQPRSRFRDLPYKTAFQVSVCITAIVIGYFVTSSNKAMSSTPNTIDLQVLGQNSVKKVPSMEPVKLETLWKDSTTVVIFLRRFGCVFCRQSAMEISKLIPLFQENNINLFAVGLEEFGYEEFVEGNYFKGDLYIDTDEASYKQIGYKKYSTMSVLMSLLSKTALSAIAKGRSEGTPGNLKGNGLQTGGTLIVSEGGTKILMDYRQDNPADHVENSEILKALGISDPQGNESVSNGN